MAGTPYTEEVLQEAAALRLSGLSIVKCAEQAGCAKSTMESRLKTAALRGMLLAQKPAMDGMRISQVSEQQDADGNVKARSVQQKPEHGGQFEIPNGHVVKGVSALLNADGAEIVKWIKTKEGAVTLDSAIETIQSAFSSYEGRAEPIPAPVAPAGKLLTLIPCNDWHVRLLTWSRETGENWDLKIAERVIGDGIEDAISRSPSSDTGIVLGGGDLLHADTDQNRTEKSGNVLDADGRHQKGIEVAQRLKVRTVDAALRNNEHVIVRILRGNHDEYSSVAIAHFLAAWYRNEPRVTVDVDASLYFWHRFGSVLLGATHGHTVKLKDMAQIMAHRRAEDWGKTRFRYVHGFHIHHKSQFVTEGGGVVSESHQAPIPQDAWHYGAGFLSGRSLQTITYHRDFGEISRVRVAMLDAAVA
jgi:hypothetical protein